LSLRKVWYTFNYSIFHKNILQIQKNAIFKFSELAGILFRRDVN